jgi:surface polysaccharide O-acyltransferase-like enzyme
MCGSLCFFGMQTTLMQEKRDLSFDAFKGVAIIAVVAIHAIYTGGSPYSPAFVYYRQLLNFSVPLFFFIAGYWSSKAKIESLRDYTHFLSGRLSRVLVPYFFWSAIWLGYAAYRSGSIDFYQIVFKLFTGGACLGYYFVIAIAQIYVLTPVLQYINRRFEWYGFAVITIFGLAAFFLLYLSKYFGVIGHLPWALPFYSWIIYYEIGLFLPARCAQTITSPKFRFYVYLVFPVSLLILLMETFFMLYGDGRLDFALNPIKYSTLLYCVCIILMFFSFKDIFSRLPVKLIYQLGYYSYGIYLVHVMILNQTATFIRRISIISSFEPVLQLVLVAVTIMVCIVIINVSHKLLPNIFCRKILGF